jgi:glycosyltransferase involved in cell wall biosynthesis
VIVGGGDPGYVGKLRALARDLGARLPQVEWVGEVWGEDRWKYFQGADLFCLPTHSENFGLAVLEACQVGTPVLTTTGTPWKDWLGGGRGYIAAATAASLRDALSHFFATPVSRDVGRTELATWARENFSWTKLAPRYLAIYHAALKP